MHNNQDHLRFRRRAIPTPGEEQPRNRFGVILTIATAAVILPAMVYGLMHPTEVRSTVKELAHHVPLQVKDLRIAIVASRTTPTPKPTTTPTPSATSTPSAHATQVAATLSAHEAHLKRLRAQELAAATAHARKLASIGQTSDVASTGAVGTTQLQSSAGSAGLQTAGTTSAQTSATSAPTPATVAVAQAPEADATPVYAPDVVVDARFTHQVPPDYPAIAKDQGAQGTAIVLATIGPDGKVISAHIDQSTGNKMLDSAALDAARESGFEPPIINGKPATETYRLVYSFTL